MFIKRRSMRLTLYLSVYYKNIKSKNMRLDMMTFTQMCKEIYEQFSRPQRNCSNIILCSNYINILRTFWNLKSMKYKKIQELQK